MVYRGIYYLAFALAMWGVVSCDAFAPTTHPDGILGRALGIVAAAAIRKQATGGCPTLGQTCSSSNQVLTSCIGAGSGTAGAIPAFCNYSLYADSSYVYNGTCTLFSESRSSADVYGMPCSTLAPFACDAYDDTDARVLTCPDPGNSGTESTCSYSNPAYGDPCISDVDCRGLQSAVNAHLVCNNTIKQCVSKNETCSSDSDCADGYFCTYRSYPPTCAATTPIGGICSFTGGPESWWQGLCYENGICYNNTYVNLFDPPPNGRNGTCVVPNSFATDTIAWYPGADYFWYQAAYGGFSLCASGLAVPVANSSGYPTGQFKCVDGVDISEQGSACDNCSPLYPSKGVDAFPVKTDNPALVCAPVNATDTRVCMLKPSSPFTAAFSQGIPEILACINNAVGPLPGAVKCTSTRLDSTCTKFKCGGLFQQVANTLYGPGGIGEQYNALWAPYFGPSTPACVKQARADKIAYTAAGMFSTCQVPPVLQNVGWACAASPISATASPGQTVTASHTLSASMGQTVTVTPTTTVTPSASASLRAATTDSAGSGRLSPAATGGIVAAVVVTVGVGAGVWWWFSARSAGRGGGEYLSIGSKYPPSTFY